MQLLDFPEHVERTEPIRQRQQELLAFDVSDEALESEIKKLMLELEDITDAAASEIRSELNSIWEFKDDYSVQDNWGAVQEQKIEMKKLA
ncbi:hypothetical protein [Brevibacillus reuszeri]|uniref:hypothetical protein n=1 Tax=Brevibacillus reuszeri TaxID=54915 RepID=UPI0039089DAB